MSEWVTGQPAVSCYSLKLFIRCLSSLRLFLSGFVIFLGSFVGRLGDSEHLLGGKAAAFEQLTCRNTAELRLTVSCSVEERESAVESTPLRMA